MLSARIASKATTPSLARAVSTWANVPAGPPDPILGSSRSGPTSATRPRAHSPCPCPGQVSARPSRPTRTRGRSTSVSVSHGDLPLLESQAVGPDDRASLFSPLQAPTCVLSSPAKRRPHSDLLWFHSVTRTASPTSCLRSRRSVKPTRPPRERQTAHLEHRAGRGHHLQGSRRQGVP